MKNVIKEEFVKLFEFYKCLKAFLDVKNPLNLRQSKKHMERERFLEEKFVISQASNKMSKTYNFENLSMQ